MRFLISVIDTQSESGTADERRAIDVFNDSLEANGHWIMAVGIASPKTAEVFDNRSGANEHTIGPINDTTEFMSGFWVINAPDIEVARQLAAEGSKACNRKVELRALLGG